MNACFICALECMFYYKSLMIGCISYCEYVVLRIWFVKLHWCLMYLFDI